MKLVTQSDCQGGNLDTAKIVRNDNRTTCDRDDVDGQHNICAIDQQIHRRHAFPPQTATTTPPPSNEGALFLNRTKRTDSASAAVDAAGGFHLAYAAYGPMVDGNEAYYAYCAANCGSRVKLGGRSFSSIVSRRFNWRSPVPAIPDCYCVGQAQIGIQNSTSTRPATLNCTNPASWAYADVTTTTFSPVFENSYSGHHYFALDNLDRPRFLYQDSYSDAFYVYCDSACTNASNWWKLPINVVIFSDPNTRPTLTFTSAGQPRITAVVMGDPTPPDYLTYITCDTDCGNPASWTYTALVERGSGHVSFVLRLTSNDQPRLVFNQGTIDPGPGNYLYYLWCNTGCTNGANWAGSSVGAQGQAEDPDLALDAFDRPRIAFRSNSPDDGLGYFWCDSSCESYSAIWQGGLVEPSSNLDDEWYIPPPANCTTSYWYNGYRPSLALDAAGNPRIGYVAQHLYGGGGCTVDEDYRAVRFAFYNQP